MLTDDEAKIAAECKVYISNNEEILINKFIGNPIPSRSSHPVSIFMAGSAGAGKTEYSKNLLQNKFVDFSSVVRIDADEIRNMIPAYSVNGCPAHLTVKACTKGVHILHDFVIANGIDFVLDGTFSRAKTAFDNVSRSLNHNRHVEIFYIYQTPENAWRFTQDRKIVERRIITPEFFIDSFLGSRNVVDLVKRQFGKSVIVNVIIQDRNNKTADILPNVNSIDSTVIPLYNPVNLRKLLRI